MKKESFLFDSVPAYPGTVHIAELLTDIEAVIKKRVIDFREALRRYVPRVDIDARIEELGHRSKLCDEADAEAKKEEEQYPYS